MAEDLCHEVLILLSQLGVGDLLACWMSPLGFVVWDLQFQIGSISAELLHPDRSPAGKAGMLDVRQWESPASGQSHSVGPSIVTHAPSEWPA